MRLVVPGDFLCYSEEYSPSANAFEDSEGKVFASAVGCEKQSDANRSLSVRSPRAKRPLKAGDLVYARIEDLYDTVALTRFRPAAPNVAPNSDSAFLRISEIRRAYVESFRGHLGIGDVLVARVKEVTPLGVYLTVIENDLGVLRAFCGACRNEMALTQKGFYCKACGAGEERKMPAPGAQPALFAEPPPQEARESRFGRGEPRSGGSRGMRGPPRGERGYRGERGGRGDRGRGYGRERGPPRGGGERGGGRERRFGSRRDSRSSRDSRDSRGPPRRKNIGSFYPAG